MSVGRTLLEILDEKWNLDNYLEKQEGAELCQAQPAKHLFFGFNGPISFGLNC